MEFIASLNMLLNTIIKGSSNRKRMRSVTILKRQELVSGAITVSICI